MRGIFEIHGDSGNGDFAAFELERIIGVIARCKWSNTSHSPRTSYRRSFMTESPASLHTVSAPFDDSKAITGENASQSTPCKSA